MDNLVMLDYKVYVLRSLKNGYRYVGHTSNIKERIKQHNQGLTKSNRYMIPFELVHEESYNTKKEAMKREKFLKSGQGRQWLDNIIKNKNNGD